MNGPVVTNVADGDSHVAVQIGVLHLDGDYVVPPGASPDELFRIGVRYLDARAPEEARALIEEAVARGYGLTAEVHFYRILALLSGRTLRHLDVGELARLTAICQHIDQFRDQDAWSTGLRAVLTLLDAPNHTDQDLAVKRVEELPRPQRDLVLEHLGVLREGPLEDAMWRLSLEQAVAGRMSDDRGERVWIYFQPQPAAARVRPARPFVVSPVDWLRVVGGGVTLLYTAGTIGWLLLRHGKVVPVLAYLAALAGLAVFTRYGTRWYSRNQLIRARDAEFAVRPHDDGTAPPDGFARRVDRLFDRYFARYVPDGLDRSLWVQYSAGIRQGLRDEVVEIYREQRINADQIAWLIRHLVGDTSRRWQSGAITDYRMRLRTSVADRAICVAGLVALAASLPVIAPAGIRAAPFAAVLGILGAVAAGIVTTIGVFRIVAERERARAEKAEKAEQLQTRQAAYERWVRKLSRRPSDAEMAEWLDCDRRVLVEETMRHYQLDPSQVITHAFIEAPGPSAKRGRIHRGPWRYSRYRMLLFLLTEDGVRQVNIDLDFEKATSQRTERLNYRFETVAAVRIDGAPARRQTFELTLFNGAPIQVQVTEPAVADTAAGEDDLTFSRVLLDASGLRRTLEVMEGIAAEGKSWINRRRAQNGERMTGLSEAVRRLIN
ncbi:hypothetical protein [Actinoplanes rectilineatus]|uniref:hypothetical protein n=1 Tax=Actinoplanes rectilineatus TaxID=113571 RepID=UPI0005F29C3A|nr:hypothetical protein [Actinoplanes rectilineatus]